MEVRITADHRAFERLAAKAQYNCNWDPTAYLKTVLTNSLYHNKGLEWLVCQTPVSKKNIIEFVSFQSVEKELSIEGIL